MSGQKEYKLQFRIEGAVDASFSGAFKTGTSVVTGMQQSLRDLNSEMKKVGESENLTQSIQKNKEHLSGLSEEHQWLSQAIKGSESSTTGMRKALSDNEAQMTKAKESTHSNKEKITQLKEEHKGLNQAIKGSESSTTKMKKALVDNEAHTARVTTKTKEYEEKLSSLKTELNAAGIDTDDLAKSNEALAKSYDKVKSEQEKHAKLSSNANLSSQAAKDARSDLLKTGEAIGVFGVQAYKWFAEPAIAFESSMTDVAKVVDGLRDGSTGKLTKEYAALKNEILEMSTVIPLSANGLAEITAAAGKAGIARGELSKFTEDAAKMAIAYDISADLAGEQMAKWRTAFSYNQNDALILADQINYLGDTSPATASEIAGIVTALAPLGEVAGFTTGEIAALGASLVAVGVDENVAATSLKQVMTTLSAGTALTKGQSDVLQKLNIDAQELAVTMQTDATGGLMTFLKAVQALPEAEQTAALTDYFGQKSIGVIAPLLANLGLLEENLVKVGDATLYLGSVEKEFAISSDTTANKLELAKNSVIAAGIAIGDQFLPAIAQGAEGIGKFASGVGDFVKENPALVKAVATMGASFAGTNLALKTGKVAITQMLSVISGAKKKFDSLSKASYGITEGLTAGQTASTGFKTGVEMLGGAVGVSTLLIGGLIGVTKLISDHQKKAREETLNFADSLMESADAYKATLEQTDTTQGLIDEYRKLEAAVADVSTKTDEAILAKERMKEIEQNLIDLYPEYRNTLVDENGLREEGIKLIDTKNEKEMAAAKLRYEQDQRIFLQKLPKSVEERNKIGGEIGTLDELIEKNLTTGEAMEEGLNRLDAAQSLPEEQRIAEEQAAINDAMEKAGLGNAFSNTDMSPNRGTLELWHHASSTSATTLLEEKKQLQEDYDTVTANIQDGYQQGTDFIAMELGGSIEKKTKDLNELRVLIDELSGKQEIDAISEEDLAALEKYKTDFDELEAKLGVAGTKQDELNVKFDKAGATEIVPMIDLNPLDEAIETFIATPRPPIALSATIDVVMNPELPGMANGGIVRNPSIIAFAEEYPEAAIPLDGGSERSLALWRYTGKQLGAMGAEQDAIPFSSSYSAGDTENIFHINIQASPSDSGNIEEQVKQGVLLALAEQKQDERRLAYK